VQGVADYEFVRPLGAGNHGQYFLAHRPPRLPVDAACVAVKVLAGESSADTFRWATRELRAFAAVRSPYLVAPFDAGQQDRVFFYSMEYLPGGSLAAPAGPLTAGAALRAVEHAARAAAALHDAGIVHRDIKPGNVLLHGGGAKLSDLGLSQTLAAGATVTGLGPVDSLEYLDPRLVLGAAPHPDHDVWSLGVLLHNTACGAGVYGDLAGQEGLLALRRILSTRPRISPALPRPLADLVRDCLSATGPRPSATDVADEVARFRVGAPA
jgi:serine/threonine protein kinase